MREKVKEIMTLIIVDVISQLIVNVIMWFTQHLPHITIVISW